jgi:hypothetical protein
MTDQSCRRHLRLAKMDDFDHSPPMQRAKLAMHGGDGRVSCLLCALELFPRTSFMIFSVIPERHLGRPATQWNWHS